MKKPAVFIDAFLSDEKRHQLFNYNLTNFIKNDWDVFVISNKIFHFNSFTGVKYFEYDPTNRVLTDRNQYKLVNGIYLNYELHSSNGHKYQFNNYFPAHSFTSWTLLYNLRRIAEILKSREYTHLIMCEYDLLFKRYDLMNTVFKDFGKTENSKKCMISRGTFGYPAMTSLYLVGVDEVLKKIPVLNTEDDFKKLLHTVYGDNTSPAYEKLFPDIFLKLDGDGNPTEGEFIPEEVIDEAQDRSKMLPSAAADSRIPSIRDCILSTPVNDNTAFIVYNTSNTPVLVEYTTKDYTTTFRLDGFTWRNFLCVDYVRVRTSYDIARNEERYYDLHTFECHNTLTLINK